MSSARSLRYQSKQPVASSVRRASRPLRTRVSRRAKEKTVDGQHVTEYINKESSNDSLKLKVKGLLSKKPEIDKGKEISNLSMPSSSHNAYIPDVIDALTSLGRETVLNETSLKMTVDVKEPDDKKPVLHDTGQCQNLSKIDCLNTKDDNFVIEHHSFEPKIKTEIIDDTNETFSAIDGIIESKNCKNNATSKASSVLLKESEMEFIDVKVEPEFIADENFENNIDECQQSSSSTSSSSQNMPEEVDLETAAENLKKALNYRIPAYLFGHGVHIPSGRKPQKPRIGVKDLNLHNSTLLYDPSTREMDVNEVNEPVCDLSPNKISVYEPLCVLTTSEMDINERLCDTSPSKMLFYEPQLLDQMENRKRHSVGRQQEKCKTARNLGESYLSHRGKGRPVLPRKIGPDCNCKKNCFKRVDEKARESIFEDFNALGDFNVQNAYLFDLIDIKRTARKTKRNDGPSRRAFTIMYHVSRNGSQTEVCKTAFLNIHGLQRNRGRVENLVTKKSKDSSAPPVDKRGRHNHHKRNYSKDDLSSVQSFIELLPKYESYNSNLKNPYKKFMSLEFTVSHCFTEYTAFCNSISAEPVSSDKFKRIFTQEFCEPKPNLCKECDLLIADLEQAKKNKNKKKVNEISTSIEEHNLHVAVVQNYINDVTNDKSAFVLTFGLQQVLPVPKLSMTSAFYKRKCFCYNLSIHDCSSDTGFFYYWDESTGGCGSDEIASCILKHFIQQDIHTEKLIIISNNVIGQNENWDMMALWLKLLADKRVNSVEHLFCTDGHITLATDKDFERVELYVKDNVQYVYCPEDWNTYLKKARRGPRFNVYQMQLNDFFKISILKEFFNMPNPLTPTVKLNIEHDTAVSVNISKTYFGLEENISLRKEGQNLTSIEFLQQFIGEIPLLYSQPRPIKKEKLDEVLSLLDHIPPVNHCYYTNLIADDISV